jgi:hypothetical protein
VGASLVGAARAAAVRDEAPDGMSGVRCRCSVGPSVRAGGQVADVARRSGDRREGAGTAEGLGEGPIGSAQRSSMVVLPPGEGWGGRIRAGRTTRWRLGRVTAGVATVTRQRRGAVRYGAGPAPRVSGRRGRRVAAGGAEERRARRWRRQGGGAGRVIRHVDSDITGRVFPTSSAVRRTGPRIGGSRQSATAAAEPDVQAGVEAGTGTRGLRITAPLLCGLTGSRLRTAPGRGVGGTVRCLLRYEEVATAGEYARGPERPSMTIFPKVRRNSLSSRGRRFRNLSSRGQW